MTQIGPLKLSSPIICAPMAGCTNFTWRQMLKRYQPGLIYCEMVKMEALLRADPGTLRLLDFSDEMHPIGAQLCGSNPLIAAEAAAMAAELGFDVIDLNCGCPVDKVTKDGSGSGMLKNPELIGEVISKMVGAIDPVPVTVKIRLGWDETCLNAKEITQIAEDAGAKAIAIHGRTRAQSYKGYANWDGIKECKEIANSIKVFGNGDLFDAQTAVDMLKYSGCDGILLARGLLGNPQLISDIHALLKEEDLPQHNPNRMLLKHLDDIEAYHNPKRSLIELRKIGCWYLKKNPGAKPLRDALNRAQSLEEARGHIESFGQLCNQP